MNDKLRKLLSEHPAFMLQIYVQNFNNRHGLLKDNFNLSDDEIKILDNEYHYTHFNGIKAKKTVQRTKKHIDLLSTHDVLVDKDNKNVCVPYNLESLELIDDSLKKLKEYGYTISYSTIQAKLF